MKLKDYDKPTMKVVKIQTTKMLMTSGVDSTRSGYGDADEQSWD